MVAVHIAVCTDGVFPEAVGGMQRHSRLLVEHLAGIPGLRITVVHPHQEGIFASSPNVQEVVIPGIDPDRFYLRELRRYSARTADALDGIRPDVILSQGFCLWKDIERFADRTIVHPHGLEMFQGLTVRDRIIGAPFRAMLRYVVRRSRATVSLGGKLTPILERCASGSRGEVVVIPNAVDVPEQPLPYPRHNAPVQLLFVGRFAFNKGLDLLIEVAGRLERNGMGERVVFKLAGDGPLLGRLRERGTPGNVELIGRVDDDRLATLYQDCDALVLPTRFEGMPTVVLEAMARARPIIVSDVGATAELVDEQNGHLIPPGDVDALHDAIVAFSARSVEERQVMGLHGHAKALARFSWPAVASVFRDLFERIADERKSSVAPVNGGPGTHG